MAKVILIFQSLVNSFSGDGHVLFYLQDTHHTGYVDSMLGQRRRRCPHIEST